MLHILHWSRVTEELHSFVSQSELSNFFVYIISTKSSSLLRQKYAEVFEALETARGPKNSESHEDRLAQILVDIQKGNVESGEDENSEKESEDDSRGIDLRASDD